MTQFCRSALLVIAAVGLTACASRYEFLRSAVVPAAKGSVRVDMNDAGDYTVEVEVANLAHPGDLTPPHTHYLVWAETAGAGARNLGVLEVGDNLKASLTAVTPYPVERVRIIADNRSDRRYPGTFVVLESEAVNLVQP